MDAKDVTKTVTSICKCGHSKLQHLSGVCFAKDCLCFEYATATNYRFATTGNCGGKTTRLHDELISILKSNGARETVSIQNGLRHRKFELGGESYLFISQNEIEHISDSEKVRNGKVD